MTRKTEFALSNIIEEHIAVAKACEALAPIVEQAAQLVIARLKKDGKILFCGNGGSATEAQHLAAELIGRFYVDRKAIPALALTADSAILTCIGNDYSYSEVFSRQLEALCTDQDVIILLSTSGKSPNILKAAEIAKNKKALSIAFTGEDGGQLKSLVDLCICIPSMNTPRIQEMHLLLGHTLCEWIENAFAH